jgi:hypothetical protein
MRTLGSGHKCQEVTEIGRGRGQGRGAHPHSIMGSDTVARVGGRVVDNEGLTG